ncbi:MAG TPA: hypothetical protein VIH42_06915, partial [Thermoguttaceae bacterium]
PTSNFLRIGHFVSTHDLLVRLNVGCVKHTPYFSHPLLTEGRRVYQQKRDTDNMNPHTNMISWAIEAKLEMLFKTSPKINQKKHNLRTSII